MVRNERGDGIHVAFARRRQSLLEHFFRRAVVREADCGTSQHAHHGRLWPFSNASFVHGRTEMREPPSGLLRANQPMDVAALHADIPDAAHLASEESFEELLETSPLTRPAGPKQPGELPIVLKTVIEAVDNHADRSAAPERVEKLGTSGHRQRLMGGTHHRTNHCRPGRRPDLAAAQNVRRHPRDLDCLSCE